MWDDSPETDPTFTRVRDFVFRNEAKIFLGSLVLPPAIVLIINGLQSVTIFNNTMMLIAGYQAIITAYLSLKIYSVSMRDSFLPSLSFDLTDVSETEVPWDDHTCVTCEYSITNHSYGRAKIRAVDVLEHQLLPDRQPPARKDVSVGFPDPSEWPVSLDKGETATFTVQINGLGYYDRISIGIDEASLGAMKYQLMLSEISNYLLMKQKRG